MKHRLDPELENEIQSLPQRGITYETINGQGMRIISGARYQNDLFSDEKREMHMSIRLSHVLSSIL